MSRARTRMFAALVAISMLTLGGPAAISAAAPEDGVEAALLVADEAPEGLLPNGIEDATEFNIDFPGYDAHGGLDKANQKWSRNTLDGTERVAVMIDFRMLFPDDAAAQAYLDEAEEILSESTTGLTLQADTPVVGDDLRHYAGTVEGSGLTAEAQNFLFRVGPVVAKLYLLGFGTTLEDVLPVAQAAADRTAAWLATRPAGSHGPSAVPSAPAASPQPSVVVPSSGPVASGGRSFSPAPAGAELRQWAVDATASSEYSFTEWSAHRAAGAPDVQGYSDDPNAWASHNSDGSEEWLELIYAQAVVPSEVGIVETLGNGAVVKIEAFDPASDAWVELWSGDDPSPTEIIATFRPELDQVTFATNQLRISFGDIVKGWSQVDAVELVGTVP